MESLSRQHKFFQLRQNGRCQSEDGLLRALSALVDSEGTGKHTDSCKVIYYTKVVDTVMCSKPARGTRDKRT